MNCSSTASDRRRRSDAAAVLALIGAVAGCALAGCSAAPPIPHPPAAARPDSDPDSSLGSAKPANVLPEPGEKTVMPAAPANSGDRDDLMTDSGAESVR